MKRFHISVDIQAPPAVVWQIITDVERWPEWTPTVTSIQRLDDGPLDVGSSVRIRQPKLRPAVWHVKELDSVNRSFTWVTHGPGVRVTAHHWVESIEPGSRATLSLEFAGFLGPLVARMTRGLNERYLDMEAKGLKQRSEQARKASTA